MTAIVLSVVVLVVAMVAASPAEDKYINKYDNVDLDDILSNERLLMNYFNCVMGTNKCTPDGEELKKRIPEALENGCEKCTDKQKAGVEKTMKFLHDKKPDLFEQLVAKFDKEGKYREKYKKLSESKGVKI